MAKAKTKGGVTTAPLSKRIWKNRELYYSGYSGCYLFHPIPL